jgi:hypothetical protein
MKTFINNIKNKLIKPHIDLIKRLKGLVSMQHNYKLQYRPLHLNEKTKFVIRLYKLKTYYNVNKEFHQQMDQTILIKSIHTKYSKNYNEKKMDELIKKYNLDKYLIKKISPRV